MRFEKESCFFWEKEKISFNQLTENPCYSIQFNYVVGLFSKKKHLNRKVLRKNDSLVKIIEGLSDSKWQFPSLRIENLTRRVWKRMILKEWSRVFRISWLNILKITFLTPVQPVNEAKMGRVLDDQAKSERERKTIIEI